MLVQVLDRLLESGDDAVLFIVGREYYAESELGRFNVASVGRRMCLLVLLALKLQLRGLTVT